MRSTLEFKVGFGDFASFFMSCLIFELSDLSIDALLIFICGIIITVITSVLDGLVWFFTKNAGTFQDCNLKNNWG